MPHYPIIFKSVLRRGLKHEDIYLKRHETMNELKAGVDVYFNFDNTVHFYQSLGYNVPAYCRL